MELKEFISEALIQIIDGVRIAQEHAKKYGAMINPDEDIKNTRNSPDRKLYYDVSEQTVEFDVAITTEESKGGKVGAGLFIAPLTIGAKVDGVTSNQTISRIKFPVPLYMPEQIE